MSSTLDILLEMGFPKAKAERALIATDNQGVEVAMEWLLANATEEGGEEDEDDESLAMAVDGAGNSIGGAEDEAAAAATAARLDQLEAERDASFDDQSDEAKTAKSLKCDECGKLFKSEVDVEFHAAKTGHQSFSESVEEVKPLTEEEKREQLRRLEVKLKQRRAEKEEEQKREQIEKEKMRRRAGQQVIEAKKKQEDEEIRKLAEFKRREKMEEKMARQRVLEQIERDKEARKLKFENVPVPAATSTSTSTNVSTTTTTNPEVADQSAKKEYTETKLQIRLTNGATLSQSFGSKEELAAVRLYIEMHRTDGAMPFNLMTNFPKKVFSEEDMEKPLYQLGLVPSAVLILTKGK